MKKTYVLNVNSLGEIRMGADAYGISIDCEGKAIKCLWETPVIVTAGDPTIDSEESSDGNYLIVKGAFATYLFDLTEMTISMFKATIRGRDGIWTEENPILGTEVRHFNGTSGKHYYVQYPFLGDFEFNRVWKRYEEKRLEQLHQLRRNDALAALKST